MCDRDRERHSVNESWMTAESMWTLVHPSCRHQSVFNLSGNGVRFRKQLALLWFCNNQKLLLLQQTYSKLLTRIQMFPQKVFRVCKTIYYSIICNFFLHSEMVIHITDVDWIFSLFGATRCKPMQCCETPVAEKYSNHPVWCRQPCHAQSHWNPPFPTTFLLYIVSVIMKVSPKWDY